MATENYYRPDGTLAIQLAHQQDKEGKLKLTIFLITMVVIINSVALTS